MDPRTWLVCCFSLGSFLVVQSAHLPLVEKPLHMMAAECATLLHQCGEELNLSGPSLTMVGMVAVSEPLFPTSPSPAMGSALESSAKAATEAAVASSTIDPEQLEPVCGSDGRTYSSRCELQRARCEGHPVRVKHRGTCHGEEKRCWSERRVALKTAKRHQEQQILRSGPNRSSTSSSSNSNIGVAGQQTFIPECTEDGRFAEVQCHLGTGYCWCVTPDGKPIRGSSIRHKKPNCKRRGRSDPKRRSPSRAKRPRKGCSPSDRASFNANLVILFTTEHNRSPTYTSTPSTPPLGPSLDTQDRRIIDWKFEQLDLNGDGQLNRREFKVLRKAVRRLVRPKRCTKNFPRFCDTDEDRKISRAEWLSCLGIDINKDSREEADHLVNLHSELEPDSMVLSKHVIKLQEYPSPKEDADQNETNDCASDRQQALDNINHGSQGMYVPDCTPDNKYKKIQCHMAGYCWCAHEDTGKPIPSTSVHNAKPNCDNLPNVTQRPVQPPKAEEHRPYVPLTAEEACGKRRSRLQSELMELFYENMSPKNSSSTRTSGSGTGRGRWNASLKERVANWQFAQLDTNKNNVMDRNELKALRTLVKRNSKLKKCSKKLPAFCDSNGDRKITPEEWSVCLGLVKGVPLVSPIAGGSPGKRRGPNPLSTYLKE